MVKRFLIFSILASVAFVAQVSAQQSKHEKLIGLIEVARANASRITCETGEDCISLKLETSFIKLENLEFHIEPRCAFSCWGGAQSDPGCDNTITEKVVRSLSRLLSRRGAIEIDAKSRTLILTEDGRRTKIILPFLESLRNPEFTLDDILKAFEEVEKRQLSKAKLN